MSMSSQNTSPLAPLEARTPQRRRGHKRVADLIEAGTQIFVEKGYDAATMTEIASRAGASIGSLYQFFPSKTLLAEAIHAEALEALAVEMDALKQTFSDQESAAWIADNLIGRLLDFMQEHPAFLVMAERRDIDPARKARTRKAMRDQIAGLLALGRPAIAPERLPTIAISFRRHAVGDDAAGGKLRRTRWLRSRPNAASPSKLLRNLVMTTVSSFGASKRLASMAGPHAELGFDGWQLLCAGIPGAPNQPAPCLYARFDTKIDYCEKLYAAWPAHDLSGFRA